nr:Ty3/gypsy retrotransposon protein [Tanacetum cinerariifolium]
MQIVNNEESFEALPDTGRNLRFTKYSIGKPRTTTNQFRTTTIDSVKGNMRKERGFWIDILKYMHETCPITHRRTYDMVNGKWKTVRLKVCTFGGVYANIIQTHTSGDSDSDYLLRALTDYQADDRYNTQKNQEMSELLKIKNRELELKAAELEIRRMKNCQRDEALYETTTDEALKERLRQRLFADTSRDIHQVRKSRRETKAPAWQKDFIRIDRIIGAFIVVLMDEATMRLLLQEQHQGSEQLAQQQVVAFQRKLDALREEIQTTRTLIQGRHGGGEAELPRSMRLDVPKFTRVDPESWLFSINEYFTLLNTPADQRLRIVRFNLEGTTAEWFRWMSRNGLITDWAPFEESVKNRFGPSKYEDPQGALSKLLQLGSVEDYQNEFEKLMNRVVDIPETLLISFYISRLKLSIQHELLVAKQVTLGDAFSLYRVTTARLDDQASTSFVPKSSNNSGESLLQRPTWTRGHKCPANFLLLMTESEDESSGEASSAVEEEVVKSGDISILNSLVGHGSPRSLQLCGKIGDTRVHILIDNGSTHNFIRPDVVESMRLSLQSTKGLDIKVDLYVLPTQGPDVVLGIQWLQQLGKVAHDYAHQVMEFTLSNTTHTLTGDASLRMKKISLHIMQALLDSEEIYDVYECHGFLLQDKGAVGGASSSTLTVHNEIEQLLVWYESLFQIPTCLPPSRVIDHHIHLLPSTKPINVRPYPYPHYQKGEMEKLVQEMLNLGIIRFSQIPFSSSILLVKKKDRSYRFCVDYRALNTVTIKDKFLIPTTDEIFDELGGASIFTKLDLQEGYHQIRVHERDIYKTVFRTHEGHYEFLVMPFGLTNAPSTFQATMNWEGQAFMILKQRLSTALLLSLPNFYQAFVIEADASGDGIGAVLMQENRPISYFSRKLGPRMRVAATYQKELFAIVEAVYKWLQYLLGRRAAYALSRMFEKDEQLTALFMTLSQPILGFMDDLREGHAQIGGGVIKKCVVCQHVKNSTEAVGGYLHPLPTPMAIWEDVFMDFITGLPPSKGNTVILVVLDRLSKYAHFGVLPTSFNTHRVAEVFLEIVVKHDGISKTIVSDLDPIFMSPFQAVHGRQPLAIIPYPSGSSKVAAVDELLAKRDGLFKQLKDSLLSAKNRTEVKANRKRWDVEFNVGDLVKALIGKVAYRLALPATSKIHPIFHVSILKPFVGVNSVEMAGLPEELHNDQPLEQPLAVCDARMVLRSGVPAQQVLVQWMGGPPEKATWEWLSDFQAAYPTFNLEDKVVF